VVGAGWIGRALADAIGVEPVPRRSFAGSKLPTGAAVLVASGRPVVERGHSADDAAGPELDHVRAVLDACVDRGARRVVVLGSSDVAGPAPVVTGTTPADPRSTYAEVKARIEGAVLAARPALDVTVARLAPVHGHGKERSRLLVRAARARVLPLPGGGHHSIGFIHLDDAVAALLVAAAEPTAPVVAIGAGPTIIGTLLRALAAAQGRSLRVVPVPVPSSLARAARPPLPDGLLWLLRLSIARAVLMEVDHRCMGIDEAARRLVAPC
jgi:nucleoside-diphosphate-sugar epimerase